MNRLLFGNERKKLFKKILAHSKVLHFYPILTFNPYAMISILILIQYLLINMIVNGI